jgi:hypothetical protein
VRAGLPHWHPHHLLHVELLVMVRDGIGFTRAAATGSAVGSGAGGARGGYQRAPEADGSPGSGEIHGGKIDRGRDARSKGSSKKKGKEATEKSAAAQPAADTGAAVEPPESSTKLQDTQAGGGGRWVHVLT